MNRSNEKTGAERDLCTAVEILLAEYSAGELDQAESDLVASHLGRCAHCRSELAREESLRETLAGLPLVRCPDRVTDSVLAVVTGPEAPPRSQPASPPLSRRWTTWVGLAAAAAAAVLIFTQPPSSGPEPAVNPVPPTAASQVQWTQAEIDAARKDLKRSLLLTARIIDRTERSTVKEVFGHTLPESLHRSIKTIMTAPEGGQG